MSITSKNALCLRCGNVWLTSLQSVCDACGCGSFQVVNGPAESPENAHPGVDFTDAAAIAWELHRPLVTIAGRYIVRAA